MAAPSRGSGCCAISGQPWLLRDGDTFAITDAGESARPGLADHAPEIRALVHAGISDRDYARTAEVLRRLIANTTGPAP